MNMAGTFSVESMHYISVEYKYSGHITFTAPLHFSNDKMAAYQTNESI
jgi:hypothetical protein